VKHRRSSFFSVLQIAIQFLPDDLVTFAKRSLNSFVVKFNVCLINLYAHTQQITS